MVKISTPIHQQQVAYNWGAGLIDFGLKEWIQIFSFILFQPFFKFNFTRQDFLFWEELIFYSKAAGCR